MLEREILEHRFDDEGGAAEARVAGRAADECELIRVLEARDLLLHEPVLEHLAHRREPLANARRIGVLEPHRRSLLRSDGGDARPHEPCANDAERGNRPGLGRG